MLSSPGIFLQSDNKNRNLLDFLFGPLLGRNNEAMIVLNTWAIVFFGYALETEHCVQIIDFVDGAFFWRDDNEAISTWFVRGWTHRADTKHNRVVNDVEARFTSSHFAHGTLFDVVMKDGLITITAVNNAGLYLHHVVLVHLVLHVFFAFSLFFHSLHLTN